MGDRTPDLRIANAALSQLSYSPKGKQSIAECGGTSQIIDAIQALFDGIYSLRRLCAQLLDPFSGLFKFRFVC